MTCENCGQRDTCEKRALSTAEASTIMTTMLERVQCNQMTQQEYNEVEKYIMGRVDPIGMSVLAAQIKRSFHK